MHREDGEEMSLDPEHAPYLYLNDGVHIGGPLDCGFPYGQPLQGYSVSELRCLYLRPRLYCPRGDQCWNKAYFVDYKDEDGEIIVTHEPGLEVQRRD